MKDTYLLIVRHGEAVGNREGRLIAQTDAPLTEWGQRQAEAVGTRLSLLPITRIISSDLPRTMQTAAPLADKLQVQVEIESALREIASGEWEGMLPDEVAEKWPDLWNRYMAGVDVQRPGGESWGDVGRRAVAAIEALDGSEQLIAVFTHGGPIIQILRWAVGLPHDTHVYTGPMGAMANTGISTVGLPGPKLLGYNDVGHLNGLTRRPHLPFYG